MSAVIVKEKNKNREKEKYRVNNTNSDCTNTNNARAENMSTIFKASLIFEHRTRRVSKGSNTDISTGYAAII